MVGNYFFASRDCGSAFVMILVVGSFASSYILMI